MARLFISHLYFFALRIDNICKINDSCIPTVQAIGIEYNVFRLYKFVCFSNKRKYYYIPYKRFVVHNIHVIYAIYFRF